MPAVRRLTAPCTRTVAMIAKASTVVARNTISVSMVDAESSEE